MNHEPRASSTVPVGARVRRSGSANENGRATVSAALRRFAGCGSKNRFHRASCDLGPILKTNSIDYLTQLVEAGADLSGLRAQYNPNLPIESLEAYMDALGFEVSEERICGNLGGAPECDCWTVGE